MTRALVAEAFRNPRRNGARIAGWPLIGGALWMAFTLVAILATLGVYAIALVGGIPLGDFLPSPFILLAMQAMAMLILAVLAFQVGRWFGGTGTPLGSLRVIIWLQLLMVLMQVAQLVAFVTLPPLAGIIGMATLVATAWLTGGMIAGLHGFRSALLTFLGAMIALLAFAFAVSLVLAPFLPRMP